MFSCEIYEILKNTCFKKHLRRIAFGRSNSTRIMTLTSTKQKLGLNSFMTEVPIIQKPVYCFAKLFIGPSFYFFCVFSFFLVCLLLFFCFFGFFCFAFSCLFIFCLFCFFDSFLENRFNRIDHLKFKRTRALVKSIIDLRFEI